MAADPSEKSPGALTPLSDEEIDQGLDRMQDCLEALDRDGEEGLQRELGRIYPQAPHTREIETLAGPKIRANVGTRISTSGTAGGRKV